MSSVPDHRQQACLRQLGEMRAGGLGRNPRRKGKLAGGQGSAIEKRREHRSSRRFPDQRRYLGDERACNHLAYITSGAVGRADEQFDGDRSEGRSDQLFVKRQQRCTKPFRRSKI